jgi:hypothetical protein
LLSFVKQIGKESVIVTMKKIISISLSLLILTAVLHFSVATHYCGGTIAATRVSLSGKLATCGMESDNKDVPLTGTFYTSHCCDNVVVFCGIYNNYFPSFSFVPESYQNLFQVFSIPAGLTFKSIASLNTFYTSVSPPGESIANSVDLSDICIFRI